jgi:hypothetical protein
VQYLIYGYKPLSFIDFEQYPVVADTLAKPRMMHQLRSASERIVLQSQ